MSPWHHLIFVEELADDVSDKADCGLCYEQAVGPVYKCLECRFIQHKSCPKPTNRAREGMERGHYYYSMWMHHLILVEEVENRGEEEVVCWGCQQPPSLPAYKCADPRCTFLLHKSCSELPHAILHPLHSDHVLTLPMVNGKCNTCFKTGKFLQYGCYSCDFYFHIKCLSRFQIYSYDCHEHSVSHKATRDWFFCEACGDETMDISYSCNICHLRMEKHCCEFSHTIRTTVHGHSLTFTHSVRLINKRDRVFCRLCRKRVNTRYGAYYCVKCGYILHFKCARKYEDKDSSTESVSSSCEEHNIYLLDWLRASKDERVDDLGKISHFNHPQHDLILSYEEPGYDKKCEACMHFIVFAPYYGCVECSFFLHLRCSKLPSTIKRGLFHEHPLTLITQTSLWKKYRDCSMCFHYREGYAYECNKCDDYMMDVLCGLLPEVLEHELHQHVLFLVGYYERGSETCNGCGALGLRYVCTDECEFGLCSKCVVLPPVTRYRYHSHPLTITFANDDEDQEDNYCFICEEKRFSNKLFYWCKECDFTVHSECILGSPFKLRHVHEDHLHPITLVETPKDTPTCKACGRHIRGLHERTAIECTQCKCFIHTDCLAQVFSKLS